MSSKKKKRKEVEPEPQHFSLKKMHLILLKKDFKPLRIWTQVVNTFQKLCVLVTKLLLFIMKSLKKRRTQFKELSTNFFIKKHIEQQQLESAINAYDDPQPSMSTM